MKKGLLSLLFIGAMSQCSAMIQGDFELVLINSSCMEKCQEYIQIIKEKIEKKALPEDQEHAENIKEIVLHEVAQGERELLLMLKDGKEYTGHTFFTIQKDGRVKITTPGFVNSGYAILVLSTFFKYLRNQFNAEIIFSLPPENVAAFQALINCFGFINDQAIAIEGEDQPEKYGFSKEYVAQMRRFRLPVDTEIK
jgi:hypothetical protein